MVDQDDLERLSQQRQTEGYGSLSDTERLWLNVRTLIDSIESGGLISYFYNPGADTFADCAAALERLGASDVHQQVVRLAHCFGRAVPTTVEERNRVIDSWPDRGREDQLIEEIDDILMPLMPTLERRLGEFLRGRGIGS